MRMYRCQHCNYSVPVNKEKGKKSAKWKMGNHYETKHKNLIPLDMTGYRWFYFLLTKKDRGSCVICHNETDFNEATMKYSRFCNNPQCKQRYKEERDNRMIKKYGKVYLLDDPDMQKKMLEGRRISGTYQWSDGKTKFQYTGSYELDFLKYLDQELKWPASDLISPSPHTYSYEYKGVSHFYMPDFFIPTMNLEIEVKSSERMEKQNNPDSREKEKIKNELMKSLSNLFNYIMISDKNYSAFNEMLKEE